MIIRLSSTMTCATSSRTILARPSGERRRAAARRAARPSNLRIWSPDMRDKPGPSNSPVGLVSASIRMLITHSSISRAASRQFCTPSLPHCHGGHVRRDAWVFELSRPERRGAGPTIWGPQRGDPGPRLFEREGIAGCYHRILPRLDQTVCPPRYTDSSDAGHALQEILLRAPQRAGFDQLVDRPVDARPLVELNHTIIPAKDKWV